MIRTTMACVENVKSIESIARVGSSKDYTMKWQYPNDQDSSCYCGTIQTMAHTLVRPLAPGPGTLEDLTSQPDSQGNLSMYI